MIKALKRLAGIALLSVAVIGMTGCDRVEPGYVGIKVNKLGDDKGVGEVVGVGRQWTGINTEVYVFPTFKQMKTYDEPFIFQMSDGTTIEYGVGVAYTVDPAKVTTVFQTYRKGVDDITNTDLRQKISDGLNKLSSRMSTDKFIDGGKATLLEDVLKEIQADLGPVGIKVMSLSWTGKPIYPNTVIESINAKVTANQKTLQRVQEVQQSTAEANKKIEEARGESESIRLRAEAEAQSINTRGDALRKNPEIMQLEAINKWDGKTPVYMAGGSNTPFITLPVPKQ